MLISNTFTGYKSWNAGVASCQAKVSASVSTDTQKQIAAQKDDMIKTYEGDQKQESKIEQIVYKTRTIIRKVVESQICPAGISPEFYNQLMEASK